jgi:hypothetical protein
MAEVIPARRPAGQALSIGALVAAVLGGAVFYVPVPRDLQTGAFWLGGSLAVVAFVLGVAGFLLQKKRGEAITQLARGALAVGILVAASFGFVWLVAMS